MASAEISHRQKTRAALRFVLMIGVVSLFADFTYEGSRSITGPFLATLGASAAVVGIVAGLGELLGYAFRYVSGKVSEKTGQFWSFTLLGYFVQMAAVPALAFAGNWQVAAALIVLERMGKAIRNPPRDVMLSHAGKEIGIGWAFGLKEGLDQTGALIGPLLIALFLAHRGQYRVAFAALLIPAIITAVLILVTKFMYPRPEDLDTELHTPAASGSGLGRTFWIYLIGASLVAAGFADYQLIAYHLQKHGIASIVLIPVFYSVAMATGGAGSMLFGKLFDRYGVTVLIPLTLFCIISAPLVFLGGFWIALLGAALWGLGMGVHDSIIPAAVAAMVPPERRPSAYGIFTAAFGVFWFLGSVAIGLLYDVSIRGAVAFCVATGLASLPFFFAVRRGMAKA
ncbi:MAG TPA: MFS transporter [Acidobacteriaceae bacterium]|nr:MFS transporter [Acidobacteriaceae bacterium]